MVRYQSPNLSNHLPNPTGRAQQGSPSVVPIHRRRRATEVDIDPRRARLACRRRGSRHSIRITAQNLNLHRHPGGSSRSASQLRHLFSKGFRGERLRAHADELRHHVREVPHRPLQRPHRSVGDPVHRSKDQGGKVGFEHRQQLPLSERRDRDQDSHEREVKKCGVFQESLERPRDREQPGRKLLLSGRLPSGALSFIMLRLARFCENTHNGKFPHKFLRTWEPLGLGVG